MATGGAGKKSAQNFVAGLWAEGKTEPEIRQELKDSGYKAGRISQLIKATRPIEAQAGAVAVVPRAARAKAVKRPAGASGLRDRPVQTEDEARAAEGSPAKCWSAIKAHTMQSTWES